jgi:nucleoside-diphosphate-sugar epimerase
MHVDDAARGFAHIIGRALCMGQIYHLVDNGCMTWAAYHLTAMRVLGRQVELGGVPFPELMALHVPNGEIGREVFAHHAYYSAEQLFRDVPEFRPVVALEAGMQQVIAAMDRAGRIPNSDLEDWEDRILAAQRQVRRSQWTG